MEVTDVIVGLSVVTDVLTFVALNFVIRTIPLLVVMLPNQIKFPVFICNTHIFDYSECVLINRRYLNLILTIVLVLLPKLMPFSDPTRMYLIHRNCW